MPRHFLCCLFDFTGIHHGDRFRRRRSGAEGTGVVITSVIIIFSFLLCGSIAQRHPRHARSSEMNAQFLVRAVPDRATSSRLSAARPGPNRGHGKLAVDNWQSRRRYMNTLIRSGGSSPSQIGAVSDLHSFICILAFSNEIGPQRGPEKQNPGGRAGGHLSERDTSYPAKSPALWAHLKTCRLSS